ncbi:hypothetical protein ACFYN3_41630 [Streptomyces lavendulae]|uniref:hypothetical protein n=1 Tax=Streptomyces lavendulae TaxID=1914 RepID=UPI0036AF9716
MFPARPEGRVPLMCVWGAFQMARLGLELCDEFEAAGRLRVMVAAWRWAVATGAVAPADGPGGRWSSAVVDAVDGEGVRAALVLRDAFAAAERLTRALGDPLPARRPVVTARMIGDLVAAGLLVRLGGEAGTPFVHGDQVAALARRRDLPALLDRHTLLGPEQAAVRLGVRRCDLAHLTRLGMLRPARWARVDFGRARGGEVDVPLYRAWDAALLPVLRPEVDWPVLRALGPGARSPLGRLSPVPAGADDVVPLPVVAVMAGVGRATVTAWRRRHPDFPVPAVGSPSAVPVFDRGAVGRWLLTHGKVAPDTPVCS